MAGMLSRVLGGVICAAAFAAAPATATAGIDDSWGLRAAERLEARPATGDPLRMPLPARESGAPAELAALNAARRPVRALVGANSHAAVPELRSTLERLGARVRTFEATGILAVRAPSGATLVRALHGDPRVAYVERDRTVRAAADPYDTADTNAGGSGIKFTWFYDEVNAATALAAAGGGSRRRVGIIDTGADLSHPELAGRVARSYDVFSRGSEVSDIPGHGTYVAGLISGVDGNGVGAKGVAGTTGLVVVRASLDGNFAISDVVLGIEGAIRRGADILNMSLAGDSFTRSQARALVAAFLNDVLPIAAAGNQGANGNPLEFPAALLGGRRGARGIGLSVGATRPGGQPASFTAHNDYVSLAAPGAGGSGCSHGVFSILPRTSSATEWDDLESCSTVFAQPGLRFAYAEGTSFSAPIAAGIAALAWQVERRLTSDQVAHVLTRAARGTGWNRYTGHGVVDGAAATALARTYDVTAPRVRGKARRRGPRSVGVRLPRTRDRTEAGRERAGRVQYRIYASRNGGGYSLVARSRKPFKRTVSLKGRRANRLAAVVCDGNGNCDAKRLGRFIPR